MRSIKKLHRRTEKRGNRQAANNASYSRRGIFKALQSGKKELHTSTGCIEFLKYRPHSTPHGRQYLDVASRTCTFAYTCMRVHAREQKKGTSRLAVVFVKYLSAWSRCVRPIKQNPIKCFVFATLFFTRVTMQIVPAP